MFPCKSRLSPFTVKLRNDKFAIYSIHKHHTKECKKSNQNKTEWNWNDSNSRLIYIFFALLIADFAISLSIFIFLPPSLYRARTLAKFACSRFLSDDFICLINYLNDVPRCSTGLCGAVLLQQASRCIIFAIYNRRRKARTAPGFKFIGCHLTCFLVGFRAMLRN